MMVLSPLYIQYNDNGHSNNNVRNIIDFLQLQATPKNSNKKS